MPFRLKLKKSRHYSVVSKSLYVISVEMLDGTTVECTLSSESIGQDCLDIVCQKLNLNQPKFYGLQYMSRNTDNNLYWLELDRPIKRQLDKYARGLTVYLRVMYYIISGVRLLNDEVTRYHYFLQLKMDVIEGRISCTPQQAVELASYSMQAEFGNFDQERHTAHYLKDFQLFPKVFTDPVLLESLTDAASRQHAALYKLPQGTAEEYYICYCQQLEGYGQEIYAVKDRFGDDAIINVSLTQVSVCYSGGREVNKHYKWADIKNVINHKREFTIETINSEKIQFQFDDVESAKNAWRFCVLQHTFYRQYEIDMDQSNNSNNIPQMPLFQQITNNDVENNKLQIVDSIENISSMNASINQQQQQQQSSLWDCSVSSSQCLNVQKAQSTSCLDINKPTNIDVLRSLLPSYRPTPDYETAVQQKYRNSSSTTAATARDAHSVLYSSQPEIHQTTITHHYPDVTLTNLEQQKNIYSPFTTQKSINLYRYQNNRINSNSTPDLAGISSTTTGQIKFDNNFINNYIVSGSSPDLVSNNNFYLKHYNQALNAYHHQIIHPIHRSQSYLPYGTYENLASIFNNNKLLRRHNHPPQAVIVENPNITKHIKKVYDEQGNIIYCMSANMKQILHENQLPSTGGFVVTRNQNVIQHKSNSNNSEPIYENVPLPWQNNDNNGEMRVRTQSIHSAPEVINHTVVNAIQSQLQQLHLNNNNSNSEILYESIHKVSDLSNDSPKSISPTNTFIINKNSSMTNPTNTIFSGNDISYNNNTSMMISNDSENNVVDISSSSSASTKTRKKRWGILIGKNKSKEKIKSATLGREKDNKRNKSGNNSSNSKYEWSTGLPYFNPIPQSLSKETMCQLLESKLTDGQLFFEFDKIPKKKQNADFTTALHSDNANFNRFKDILPYEENRIRLTPSKKNKFGYINASHITATVGSKQRFYIAAQGPTPLTLPYFWQCVWEAEVYLIVQLTDTNEDLDYMPNNDERCIDIQDYLIWWEFSQKSGHCITSKVRLCHVASRRYRTLWHLHYTDWGEQGCPHSVGHFLGFLEEMQSVHQHSMGEIPPGHNKNSPILIHCTAGVGRTGLTILSTLLLCTVDHNQEVCIPHLVGLLRHQRAYMIQTIAQYKFVYQLLIHYLKQTRLI